MYSGAQQKINKYANTFGFRKSHEDEYDLKKNKKNASLPCCSCDFPGVLEEEERLPGPPLGLYGLPGQRGGRKEDMTGGWEFGRKAGREEGKKEEGRERGRKGGEEEGWDYSFRRKTRDPGQNLQPTLLTWRRTLSQGSVCSYSVVSKVCSYIVVS